MRHCTLPLGLVQQWECSKSVVRGAGLRQAFFVNITGNFHPGQQKVHISMWD